MPPDRLQLLWDQFLAGTLAPADAAELLKYLRAHPEELQRRRSEAAVHGGLSYLFGSTAAQERLVASVQARLSSTTAEGEAPFEQKVMRELRQRRSRRATGAGPWWIAGAAAALLALAVLAWKQQQAPEIGTAQPKQRPPAPQPPTQQPETLQARVEVLSGNAHIGTRALSAAGSSAINPGESLTLEPAARARVTMGDGSSAELSHGGVLIWRANEPAPHWRLERGVAELEVQPQTPGKELRLETAHARVHVLGTRYRVVALERASVVEVLRGKVAVTALEKPAAAPTTLAVGEVATVNAEGVRAQNARTARVLSPQAAAVEPFTDPVQLSESDAVAYWPVRRLSYTRPEQKPGRESLGYGGMVWKGGLNPGEESFEIWIRPRRVELAQAGNRLMKVVLLASTGATEYRLGDIHIFPTDREWMLLRGQFTGSAVNWQDPGRERIPLQSSNVVQLSIRTEIGNIDFDFGPLTVLKSDSPR